MTGTPIEKTVDDLVAQTQAILERYGMKNGELPVLSIEEEKALYWEVKQLMPRRRRGEKRNQGKRGPKINRGRLQHDLNIYVRLSAAEDKPGGVVRAAKDLANQWAEHGYHVEWKSVRARYYKLKKKKREWIDEHV